MFRKRSLIRIAVATALLMIASVAIKAPVQRGAFYAPMLENVSVTDANACVANVWCTWNICSGDFPDLYCVPYAGEFRIDCKCNYNHGATGTVCINREWQ